MKGLSVQADVKSRAEISDSRIMELLAGMLLMYGNKEV